MCVCVCVNVYLCTTIESFVRKVEKAVVLFSSGDFWRFLLRQELSQHIFGLHLVRWLGETEIHTRNAQNFFKLCK